MDQTTTTRKPPGLRYWASAALGLLVLFFLTRKPERKKDERIEEIVREWSEKSITVRDLQIALDATMQRTLPKEFAIIVKGSVTYRKHDGAGPGKFTIHGRVTYDSRRARVTRYFRASAPSERFLAGDFECDSLEFLDTPLPTLENTLY